MPNITGTTAPELILAAVESALETSAPTFLGAEHISDVDSPPRYVWAPDSDSTEQDFDIGANPPAIGCFRTGFSVHVWGTTFGHTWRLRQVLLTALRDIEGASFRIGPARWTPGKIGDAGYLCLQSVSLLIPVVAAAYPVTFGDPIVDAVGTTTKATLVETTPVDFGTPDNGW